MPQFNNQKEIEPNKDLLDYFKDKIKLVTKGSIEAIKSTNIKAVMPTVYELTYNDTKLNIYDYNGNFKNDRNFYIPDFKKSYYVNELKQVFKDG